MRFAKAYSVGAAFGIKDGDFDHLFGSVGNLNAAIGPGIFLQTIGFGVTRNPLTLAGTAGFSAGPSLAGKKAVTVGGGFKAVLADPFVVEVNGEARVADRFKLGEAFVRYSSDGLFEVAGKIDWSLGPGYVEGRVLGFVDGLDAASLEGRVRGCISVKYLPDPCAGAGFIVSNIGIAACIDLTIVAGGIGYYWGGDFDLFGGSCDLGPWRPVQELGASGRGEALHASGRHAERGLCRRGGGRRSGRNPDAARAARQSPSRARSRTCATATSSPCSARTTHLRGGEAARGRAMDADR